MTYNELLDAVREVLEYHHYLYLDSVDRTEINRDRYDALCDAYDALEPFKEDS